MFYVQLLSLFIKKFKKEDIQKTKGESKKDEKNKKDELPKMNSQILIR